jgi:hypothetical protein
MSSGDDRTLWVHYHVPKTGGQTIRHELVAQLEIGTSFVHLGPWAVQQGYFPATPRDLAGLEPDQLGRIRVIAGHNLDAATVNLFDCRHVKEIVVLRDPAQRIVSQFNFKSFILERRDQPEISFDTWYEGLGSNPMTRFLAKRLELPVDVDALIERLKSFEFVGRTEDMDQWLPHLLRAMGLTPVLPKRANVTGVDHQRIVTLDDSLHARIQSDNPLDYMLYDGTLGLCRLAYERIQK